MATLFQFLGAWFSEETLVFRQPPQRDVSQAQQAANLLERAWRQWALNLPGQPPRFDPDVGSAAAELFRFAAWHVVSPGAEPEEITAQVRMPHPPNDPAQHLSADLLFRALPTLLGRARQSQPGGALVRALEELAREWPLSGVLCRMTDGPLLPPDFDDDLSTSLLYAERFSAHRLPAWAPANDSLAAQQVALIASM